MTNAPQPQTTEQTKRPALAPSPEYAGSVATAAKKASKH